MSIYNLAGMQCCYYIRSTQCVTKKKKKKHTVKREVKKNPLKNKNTQYFNRTIRVLICGIYPRTTSYTLHH